MASAKPTYRTTPAVRPIDLSTPRRVHLVGIGGAGMSAIATVLAQMGHDVRGSDQSDSGGLDQLRALGIEVFVGHGAEQLGTAEIVSRSTAIPDSNPEVQEAERRGLEVHRRDELLTAITRLRETVAVGGTHGKTTTSSMLAVLLRSAGRLPSFIIGGRVQGWDVGAAVDSGPHMIVEADESDGTFLRLHATAAIVTSVEPDHLDYYGDRESFEEAFVSFLERVAGPRILSIDDPAALRVADRVAATTYGTNPQAEYTIEDYTATREGSQFRILRAGDRIADVALSVPGLHNARNATAAWLMARALGVSAADAVEGLARFGGVARRYEKRGECAGIVFIDDYAHLPSEVALTLEAARAGRWERVVCVFQPHRYTRTQALGAEFADSFQLADHVVVTGIYSAGEAPIAGVDGAVVSDAIMRAHPSANIHLIQDRESLIRHLVSELRPGDLCLTLGAGDLTTLPDALMATLGAGA